MAEVQFINFVLIGQMGWGKSSTGNKLIKAVSGTSGATTVQLTSRRCGDLLKNSPQSASPSIELEFEEGKPEQRESCTKKCELLSCGNIRVLDVPGFSGSERPEGVTVKQQNTQYIRWIIRIQDEFKMKIHRVLYFIPHRGALQKADGAMKEQLECLQYFFGNAIFESMIMIATYDPDEEEQQKRGFGEKQFEATKSSLATIFSSMPKLEDTAPRVPRLVYLGVKDSAAVVHKKIMEAQVVRVDGLNLSIVEGTCIKCAKRVEYSLVENRRILFVKMPNNTTEPYSTSKCHPLIIPKYSKLQKVIGGIAHIITLGIPYLLFSQSWPGFTNTSEECISCKGPPGSDGCKAVDEKHISENGTEITVQHKSTIEYTSAAP